MQNLKENKLIFFSIVIAVVLIGAAYLFSRGDTGGDITASVNNVSIVDGKQIIEIRAKGGFTPGKTLAKAGLPTILRLETKGTFDCSSSVRIPSLNVSKILPQTGTTDIDLGNPKLGILKGMCGMGMYPFEIDFQS